jgi:hypothetical protein
VAQALSDILNVPKDEAQKAFFKALPSFVRLADEPIEGDSEDNAQPSPPATAKGGNPSLPTGGTDAPIQRGTARASPKATAPPPFARKGGKGAKGRQQLHVPE